MQSEKVDLSSVESTTFQAPLFRVTGYLYEDDGLEPEYEQYWFAYNQAAAERVFRSHHPECARIQAVEFAAKGYVNIPAQALIGAIMKPKDKVEPIAAKEAHAKAVAAMAAKA